MAAGWKVWEGNWEERIGQFARAEGYPHIWDWLLAHPCMTLNQVAEKIGSAAPIQIDRIVSDHCEMRGSTYEWMLDKLVRCFHKSLPKGWTGSSAAKESFLFFWWRSGFARKYETLMRRMQDLVSQLDVPEGWSPQSKDDPHLIRVRDQALKEVAVDHSYVEPGVAYWQLVAPYSKEVSIYDGAEVFLEQFGRVPRKSGLLLAAHWCQSEVCNGGFEQFFGNSTGVLAPEALQAFKEIGLDEWSDALEKAMAVLGAAYPREQVDRLEIIKKSNVREMFNALESSVFSWKKDDRDAFAKLADKFALEKENSDVNRH